MITIPNYLKDISKIESGKKNRITLKISCTCDGDIFQVYQNKIVQTEEEVKFWKDFEKRYKLGFEVSTLKDGKSYVFKRNFLGMIVGKSKMLASDMPNTDTTEIIKSKCAKCGKEYILFDSRLNGYDACIDEKKDLTKIYDFKQKKVRNAIDNLVRIKIDIYNDETLEEFVEASGIQADREFYANAFGWIKIIGIVPNQDKRITIFEKETQ